MSMLNRTPVDRMFIDTVTSVLERTVLPTFQRSEDEQHIDNIYTSISKCLEDHMEPKITGCLITVVLDDTYYLLDGNHRLHAYRRIHRDYDYNIKIYVQEIRVSNIEEAEKLFEQTNNSVPVSKMPEGVRRSDVNHIAEHFYKKYSKTSGKIKPLFSTGNTNRPRINRVKFEETLSQILNQGSNQSDEIISRIEQYISDLDQKNCMWFKRGGDTRKKLETMLEKADLLGCRLGMVKLTDIRNLFNGSSLPLFERCKQSIPKSLRTAVWDRYCGRTNRISRCPFCQSEIMVDDFHCAHDLAEADGGELSIDNLYPCCSSCNLSMGKQTFEQFRAIFAGARVWKN